MTKKTLMNLVIEKLKEYDVEIFGNNYEKGTWYILAKDMIISIKDTKIINISFHVICLPDYSASVVYMLSNELRDCFINIKDVFTYDKDGTIFYGEEASNIVEKQRVKSTIDQFIHDQMEKSYLLNAQYGDKQ